MKYRRVEANAVQGARWHQASWMRREQMQISRNKLHYKITEQVRTNTAKSESNNKECKCSSTIVQNWRCLADLSWISSMIAFHFADSSAILDRSKGLTQYLQGTFWSSSGLASGLPHRLVSKRHGEAVVHGLYWLSARIQKKKILTLQQSQLFQHLASQSCQPRSSCVSLVWPEGPCWLSRYLYCWQWCYYVNIISITYLLSGTSLIRKTTLWWVYIKQEHRQVRETIYLATRRIYVNRKEVCVPLWINSINLNKDYILKHLDTGQLGHDFKWLLVTSRGYEYGCNA